MGEANLVIVFSPQQLWEDVVDGGYSCVEEAVLLSVSSGFDGSISWQGGKQTMTLVGWVLTDVANLAYTVSRFGSTVPTV